MDPSLLSEMHADESECTKIGGYDWSGFYEGHSSNIWYGLRVMALLMMTNHLTPRFGITSALSVSFRKIMFLSLIVIIRSEKNIFWRKFHFISYRFISSGFIYDFSRNQVILFSTFDGIQSSSSLLFVRHFDRMFNHLQI